MHVNLQKKSPFPTKTVQKDRQWQQPGRAFYFMLWNQGRTALFSRRFIPKGGQCHTNLLLITLLCEWCSIILLFLAGWAPHKAAKARLWWRWQMVSSLGLVLILPFQMSAFKKKKKCSWHHTSRWMQRCSMHQHCTLSRGARHLQYLTLTPSRSASTLSTPI